MHGETVKYREINKVTCLFVNYKRLKASNILG